MEKQEKETVINWNDAEDFITIFTCHVKIMNRLERFGFKETDKCILNGKIRHKEYRVPKDKLSVILRHRKPMSTRQKEQIRERAILNPSFGRKVTKT